MSASCGSVNPIGGELPMFSCTRPEGHEGEHYCPWVPRKDFTVVSWGEDGKTRLNYGSVEELARRFEDLA